MSDPHAKELLSILDGLPLAIATAGAYLYQVPSTSLGEYLSHYHSSWLKLQQTSPELSSYEDKALYTTWNVSVEHVRTLNPLSVKLLQLWAYFDNHDLWFGLLAAGRTEAPQWSSEMTKDELSFNEALRPLCNHALVQSLGIGSGYGMHSCVHAWSTHVLNSERNALMTFLAMTCVSAALRFKATKICPQLSRRSLEGCRFSVKAG